MSAAPCRAAPAIEEAKFLRGASARGSLSQGDRLWAGHVQLRYAASQPPVPCVQGDELSHQY